jgi:hypothetical protein
MRAGGSGLRIGNLLLALCCLTLAGLIYLQLDRDLSARPAPDDRPKASLSEIKRVETRAAAGDPFRPAPLDAYGDIVERPLFHRTRRPIAAAEAHAAADKGLPLHLAGIVADAGRLSAFFKVKDAPRMVRVSEGGSVEGWTVQAIEGNGVTLLKKGRTARLSTKDPRPAAKPEPGLRQTKATTLPGNQERPRRKQDENKD